MIPARYHKMVLGTFDGIPKTIELTDDITVYRYWGGIAGETGSPWYSLEIYTPTDARVNLALADGNTAVNVTKFKIPAGIKILQGKVTNMVGETGFGNYATGGGTQIYLPDPSIAQMINY